MNFERQLEKIKNKDDLHKWVDSLSDDSVGIILTYRDSEDDDRSHCRYHEIGSIDVKSSLWLITGYSHFLMNVGREDV